MVSNTLRTKKKMFHCSVVPLNHIGQLKGDAGSSLCRT